MRPVALTALGGARLRFDEAGDAIERLQSRLRETGLAERAGLLEVALSYLRQAADQAEAFDASAQSAAEAALQTLERVQGSTGQAGSELDAT